MRFLTLRYFNAVAKLGSIRKAADRLHVAPRQVAIGLAESVQRRAFGVAWLDFALYGARVTLLAHARRPSSTHDR